MAAVPTLRLGIAGGMSQNGRNMSITPRGSRPQTNSAELATAEREIQMLTEENVALKVQLNEYRSLYEQLIMENKEEKFDERRVTLLKSHVIQLERQVLLLKEAVAKRATVLMDVENSLAATVQFCVTAKETTANGVPVKLSRLELERVVETMESCRLKLYKNIENSSSEKLSKPLIMFSSFIKNKVSSEQPITMLDVCSGELDHINLKHVSRLESQLMVLYRRLMLVDSSLRTICCPASADTPRALYQSLSHHVTDSCDLLRDVCRSLLQLSLLIPAAPLPNLLRRPVLSDVTVDNLLGVFKSKNKSELRGGAETIVKTFNYSLQMAAAEKNLLSEELNLHRAVYALQTNYIDSLLTAIKNKYMSFEEDIQSTLCAPIKDILRSYDNMKAAADEKSLLAFVATFRSQSAQLARTIEMLSFNEESNREKEEALSEFGRDFLHSLQSTRLDCQHRRDNLVAKATSTRQQLDEQLQAVSDMFGSNKTQTFQSSEATFKPTEFVSSRLAASLAVTEFMPFAAKNETAPREPSENINVSESKSSGGSRETRKLKVKKIGAFGKVVDSEINTGSGEAVGNELDDKSGVDADVNKNVIEHAECGNNDVGLRRNRRLKNAGNNGHTESTISNRPPWVGLLSDTSQATESIASNNNSAASPTSTIIRAPSVNILPGTSKQPNSSNNNIIAVAATARPSWIDILPETLQGTSASNIAIETSSTSTRPLIANASMAAGRTVRGKTVTKPDGVMTDTIQSASKAISTNSYHSLLSNSSKGDIHSGLNQLKLEDSDQASSGVSRIRKSRGRPN